MPCHQLRWSPTSAGGASVTRTVTVDPNRNSGLAADGNGTAYSGSPDAELCSSTNASVASVAPSTTPVTVTTCATAHCAAGNTREVGDTVMSGPDPAGTATVTVTGADGIDPSVTVYVAALSSGMTSRAVDTSTPATSLSSTVTASWDDGKNLGGAGGGWGEEQRSRASHGSHGSRASHTHSATRAHAHTHRNAPTALPGTVTVCSSASGAAGETASSSTAVTVTVTSVPGLAAGNVSVAGDADRRGGAATATATSSANQLSSASVYVNAAPSRTVMSEMDSRNRSGRA
jgi:hypothetical protein